MSSAGHINRYHIGRRSISAARYPRGKMYQNVKIQIKCRTLPDVPFEPYDNVSIFTQSIHDHTPQKTRAAAYGDATRWLHVGGRQTHNGTTRWLNRKVNTR